MESALILYFSPCSNTTDLSHLQCIWLSKVCHPSDLHGDPHVDHLGGDVAEWQVADHHLLCQSSVFKTHVTAGGERSPSNLREGEREGITVCYIHGTLSFGECHEMTFILLFIFLLLLFFTSVVRLVLFFLIISIFMQMYLLLFFLQLLSSLGHSLSHLPFIFYACHVLTLFSRPLHFLYVYNWKNKI